MERILSDNEQSMVSCFLEIAVGQTAETAVQFLQATSWKLEEALQLFYIGNEGTHVASASPSENAQPSRELKNIENINAGLNNADEVRPPLPVVRETLYDDMMAFRASRMGYPPQESSSVVAFRNFDEEMKNPGVWESDQGATSTADDARDNLASLYRPPFHLMLQGSFEKAKGVASVENKWLLVNIQSTKEFSSHMLNRDTWANEAVSQTISNNFIFWQVYDDTSGGKKVCTYYKLDSIPVVLVIDPITGQKMRSWSGMVQPESLLEDLVPFMDGHPKDHHATLSHKRQKGSSQALQKNKGETNEEDEEMLRALAASMEVIKDLDRATSDNKDATGADKDEKSCLVNKPVYPPLPEEPKGDRSLLCRVGVRFPDGRRVQRNFLKTDPLQLLWSFVSSQLEEAATRRFQLIQSIPGSKSLEYDSKISFAESGVANSMISVAWE
ncbi:plant UBX domain-containing protein 7 [Mercurialis annua]|uniref:plant UBX domain-containing protein 7 n=1 Tax=Mercurialis annua TaxID=3986 RepID=UPI00215F465E|nr:plant UBX domain-containing protein 7 [Mercurialis annua]